MSSLAVRHAVKFSMVMMDAQWRRHAVWWLLLAVLFVMLLGACAVPEHMRVRAGIDPRNQDDNVRFRSTYYFRVFDVCRNPDNGEVEVHGPPQLDSLYRFRMTGKASSFFSRVHFESGTLHKSEIDPFGSNVVPDKNLGGYRVVSREETGVIARRNERYDQIERRLKLLEKIYKHVGSQANVEAFEQLMEELGKSTDQISEKERQQRLETLTKYVDESRTQLDGDFKETFVPIMKALVNSIKNQIVNLDPLTISNSKNNSHKNSSNSRDVRGCPEGTELKRGFQIMGPEGISTFNQDQRLVMAMTSSGKPLISMLKMLSGGMLAAHGSGSESLLPLAQEHIAVLRAKRVIDKLQDDQKMMSKQLIQQVIDVFNQDASQEAW